MDQVYVLILTILRPYKATGKKHKKSAKLFVEFLLFSARFLI